VIFEHHARALAAGDMAELLVDYSDDAVIITPHGSFRGAGGAQDAFTRLFQDLPNAQLELTGVADEGDVVLVTWSARTDRGPVTDGVDTFVCDGDRFRAQTVHYTVGV
jgi:ketosteroid isomerase-like protein